MSTLLIVEDDPNIRHFVTANLKARGYNILQAESAEEGLRLLQEHKPEALVLDIKLPGMNGWNMLKVIADDPQLPKVPVTIQRGSRQHDDGNLRQLRVITRLSKP